MIYVPKALHRVVDSVCVEEPDTQKNRLREETEYVGSQGTGTARYADVLNEVDRVLVHDHAQQVEEAPLLLREPFLAPICIVIIMWL